MKTADFERMEGIQSSGALGAANKRHGKLSECQSECILSKRGCIGIQATWHPSGLECLYHFNWENFEGKNISLEPETDLYIRRTCQGNVSILSEA